MSGLNRVSTILGKTSFFTKSTIRGQSFVPPKIPSVSLLFDVVFDHSPPLTKLMNLPEVFSVLLPFNLQCVRYCSEDLVVSPAISALLEGHLT